METIDAGFIVAVVGVSAYVSAIAATLQTNGNQLYGALRYPNTLTYPQFRREMRGEYEGEQKRLIEDRSERIGDIAFNTFELPSYTFYLGLRTGRNLFRLIR